MAKKGLDCSGFCAPTVIQIIILVAALMIIYSLPSELKLKNGGVLKVDKEMLYGVVLIGGLFWTAIYYYLCRNCMHTAAWLLLLAPLILGILMGGLQFITSLFDKRVPLPTPLNHPLIPLYHPMTPLHHGREDFEEPLITSNHPEFALSGVKNRPDCLMSAENNCPPGYGGGHCRDKYYRSCQ